MIAYGNLKIAAYVLNLLYHSIIDRFLDVARPCWITRFMKNLH